MITRVLSIVRRIARGRPVRQIAQSSAAIAYFAIFALAPTLVFATTVATRFLSREDARQMAEQRLAETLGPGAADLARTVLDSADFTRHGTIATVASIVLLVFGASSVFVQLRASLNRIFGHAPGNPGEAIRGFVLGRLTSTAFAFFGGAILLASLLGSVVLHAVTEYFPVATGFGKSLWTLCGPLLSIAVVAIVLWTVFALLPARRPPLRFLAVGAVTSALLFELGKWILGHFIASSLIATAYGPSSSLVAFLVWIFYSAQIILLGAELSQAVYEESAPPQRNAPG